MDILARSGRYPAVTAPPYRPGVEIAGIVTGIAADVTDFAVGDRVAGITLSGGGYSSQLTLSTQYMFKLPDHIDYKVAAGLVIQGMTAYFLVEEAQVKAGETVLINGAAGGTGSLAVQIASHRGAKVLGLASATKHSRVKALGAIEAFTYDAPNWSDRIVEYNNGRGVDVFIDSQGDLGGEGFKVLSRGGRWMVYGWMEQDPQGFPADQIKPLIFANVSIRGYSTDWSAPHFSRALKDLWAWVTDGTIRLDITEFALEDAAKAHGAIASRLTTGKVILIP
jgi:NADPH2:quinone reductase